MIFIPIKYTINDVREYVKNKSNCDLISSEYKGCDYKYDLICSCGNEFQMSWSNIQRNQNICCKDCLGKILSKAMSFTYDEVKHFVEIESNSGCLLLNKQYTDSRQKLKLRCRCGDVFWKTLNDFKHGNQRQCNECANRVVWDKELIIKYVGQYPNLELININDDLNYKSNLLLKCECGVTYETTFKYFKKGIYKCCHNCMIEKRALNIRNSYEEVKRNIESVEGYKLLSKTYSGYRKRLKIQCPESHVFYMSYGSFYFAGCRCLVCSESKGERAVREYLEEVCVKFKQEFTFDDLKGVGGNLLRFDFAIFDNDDSYPNLIIEYDGEFHFKKQYKDDGFEALQLHDNLKNSYCQDKNIKLIRIPYWELNNIKTILKEVLYESI